MKSCSKLCLAIISFTCLFLLIRGFYSVIDVSEEPVMSSAIETIDSQASHIPALQRSQLAEQQAINYSADFSETLYLQGTPRTPILSISELVAHLNSGDKINVESVVDFTNTSIEAFNYLRSEYNMSYDVKFKKLVLGILSNTSHLEKSSFARELIQSDSVSDRRMGYKWLAQMDPNSEEFSNKEIVDAIEYENDPEVLLDLVSMITVPTISERSNAHRITLTALEKLLSNPPTEAVRIQAVSKLIDAENPSRTVNEAVIGVLTQYLLGQSEMLQFIALKKLQQITRPNQTLMRALNELIAKPSTSQEIKSLAVDLIIVYENQITAH